MASLRQLVLAGRRDHDVRPAHAFRSGAAPSLAAVFGIAGVVAVFVGVLSIGEGFRTTLARLGLARRRDRPAQRRRQRDGQRPRPRRDAPHRRRPRASARDAEGAARLRRAVRDHQPAQALDRHRRQRARCAASSRAAFAVRDHVQIVEGRMFEWGKNEVIVGGGAAREFARPRGRRHACSVGRRRLAGGRHLHGRRRRRPSPRSGPTPRCCRPPTSAATPSSRSTSGSNSPGAFDEFKDALTANPQLERQGGARRRSTTAAQPDSLTRHHHGLGFLVAVLMAIGAVFGALNTMYSAVAARTREIATLRALGFGGGAVVVSVLAEAAPGARSAASLGAGAAYVRLQRLPRRDHELAELQPGGLRLRGHPVAAGPGHACWRWCSASSAASSPPSAPPACPWPRPCGRGRRVRRRTIPLSDCSLVHRRLSSFRPPKSDEICHFVDRE